MFKNSETSPKQLCAVFMEKIPNNKSALRWCFQTAKHHKTTSAILVLRSFGTLKHPKNNSALYKSVLECFVVWKSQRSTEMFSVCFTVWKQQRNVVQSCFGWIFCSSNVFSIQFVKKNTKIVEKTTRANTLNKLRGCFMWFCFA